MKTTLKILLLEENAADAALIQEELKNVGYPLEFRRAENKKDFLRVFVEFKPHFVLSDYMIGSLSGVDIMSEIRKRHPRQPFIFVSWEIHESSVVDALKAGATDYVFKDQLSRLTLSIHRALRELRESEALDKAHEKIQKSEEYFRMLIENAGDMILVLDEAAVIRFASPSVKKVLGYEPNQFVGKKLLDFIHAEDQESASTGLLKDQSKPDFSLELRFQHQDGSWRGLEAIGKNVHADDGSLQVVINARDITDRILEQEALRESIVRHLKTQTELQKTQQRIIQQERMAAIGQMASGIAHDFSNALMPVLGFSEILLSRPAAMLDLERVKKYLEMINTSARDAMNIVGGLREFYRRKEKTENMHPINLNKTIQQVVLMTQPKWKEEANSRGVHLQVTMHLEPIPNIFAYEASIREALINLIFNAVDAMPARPGIIDFKTYSENGQVVLEVADNGSGMDEETRARCLEPFFSTKGKSGTGLGLSMVYGVVQRHEGAIDVRSKLGEGSTFVIHFPAKELPVTSKEAFPVILPTVNKRLHVLMVDDEPMVREVMKEYLTGDGHSVEMAENGRKALQLFKESKFDLVITDRAMPEMGGDELCIEIKKLSPKTPLIMLTGFGELMKAKEEHPLGVDHLLSKPLTFEEYRKAIVRATQS